MAGHAQLKFIMTECSKTHIRLTRSNCHCCFNTATYDGQKWVISSIVNHDSNYLHKGILLHLHRVLDPWQGRLYHDILGSPRSRCARRSGSQPLSCPPACPFLSICRLPRPEIYMYCIVLHTEWEFPHIVMILISRTDSSGKIVQTKIRPDCSGAVCSGSALFAILTASFGHIILW